MGKGLGFTQRGLDGLMSRSFIWDPRALWSPGPTEPRAVIKAPSSLPSPPCPLPVSAERLVHAGATPTPPPPPPLEMDFY